MNLPLIYILNFEVRNYNPIRYSGFFDLGVVFHDLKKLRDDGANLPLDSDSAPQNVYSFRSAVIFMQFIQICPMLKAEYFGFSDLGVVFHGLKNNWGVMAQIWLRIRIQRVKLHKSRYVHSQ